MVEKKYLNLDLDLTIKDLTVHDEVIEIHPDFFSLPTNIIYYGKSSAGKSNTILNNLKWLKPYVNGRVIVFMKSTNGSISTLKKTHGAKIYNTLFDSNGKNRIEKIMEYQKMRKDSGEKLENIIILLDDFITDRSITKKGSIYEDLFSFGRHFNITTMLTAQSFVQVPAVLRRLSFNDIIYKMSNRKEKDLMCYEMCNAVNLTEREFEKVYDDAVEQPYSFLYVNKRKGIYNTRFGK